MIFPYSEVEFILSSMSQIRSLVPWLPIELSLSKDFKMSAMPLGLLDSGADTSILTKEAGKIIGIKKIKNDKLVKMTGVGGGSIKGYIHKVYHRLHNPKDRSDTIVFEGDIVIADTTFQQTMPQSTAIWGRNSVFSETLIKFDDPKKFEIWI